MSVEAPVYLFSAVQAQSSALLAVGGDSAVELLSAIVVLWRFRAGDEFKPMAALLGRAFRLSPMRSFGDPNGQEL